jgi:2-methylcitrate dehydratase PrpD
MTMNLAGELSEYALSLRYSDLGEHAVHTARQRLVESLGCGLGAFAAVPARNARAFAREHPSTASTVLGTTQTYNEEAISNAEVLTLMQRVSVREDPALTAMLPEYIPNRVTVRLTTGRTLTEEVLDAPGGARVPVTDAQLEDKFHGLVRPFASDAQRASILSHAWGIEKLPDLAPLFASTTLDAGRA